MIYDRTRERVEQDSFLLQVKPKRSWNPLHYLFVAWEHFAYQLLPPGIDPCLYCWGLRLFVAGALAGAALVHWWPK